MELTMLHNILLLALVRAYGEQNNAYIMLEDVSKAVRLLELATTRLHGGHSSRVPGALITLESQKLVRMECGRVYLTAIGINACQGLALSSEWEGLPTVLKPYVKIPA